MIKPDGCSGCPLFEKGRGFVPDKRVPHPDVVLVGEAPGKHEVEEGEPFVGQAGYVLKNWLLRAVAPLQVQQEKGKITFANTLRCLPPEIQGRPYPKGQEKLDAEAHCRQYDDFGEAKTVILFGESPQRAFFGPELAQEDATDKALGHDLKGTMGRIGRTYQRDGRTWVFAPHPAYILRQPALVGHGQQALKIAAGDERLADVDYIPWASAMEVL